MLVFRDPRKALHCMERRHLTYFASKSVRAAAVAFLKNQKMAESLCAERRKITHAQNETPKSIWIKFCTVVDIPDVVNYTNFGDHRVKGSLGGGGSNFPLSHRLSSSPL